MKTSNNSVAFLACIVLLVTAVIAHEQTASINSASSQVAAADRIVPEIKHARVHDEGVSSKAPALPEGEDYVADLLARFKELGAAYHPPQPPHKKVLRDAPGAMHIASPEMSKKMHPQVEKAAPTPQVEIQVQKAVPKPQIQILPGKNISDLKAATIIPNPHVDSIDENRAQEAAEAPDDAVCRAELDKARKVASAAQLRAKVELRKSKLTAEDLSTQVMHLFERNKAQDLLIKKLNDEAKIHAEQTKAQERQIKLLSHRNAVLHQRNTAVVNMMDQLTLKDENYAAEVTNLKKADAQAVERMQSGQTTLAKKAAEAAVKKVQVAAKAMSLAKKAEELTWKNQAKDAEVEKMKSVEAQAIDKLQGKDQAHDAEVRQMKSVDNQAIDKLQGKADTGYTSENVLVKEAGELWHKNEQKGTIIQRLKSEERQAVGTMQGKDTAEKQPMQLSPPLQKQAVKLKEQSEAQSTKIEELKAAEQSRDTKLSRSTRELSSKNTLLEQSAHELHGKKAGLLAQVTKCQAAMSAKRQLEGAEKIKIQWVQKQKEMAFKKGMPLTTELLHKQVPGLKHRLEKYVKDEKKMWGGLQTP